MTSTIYISVASIFYTLLLFVAYFLKKRMKNIENSIFSKILIITFFGILIEFLCGYTLINEETMPILNFIVQRLYLILLFTWIVLFTFYTFIISFKKNDDETFKSSNLFKISKIIFLIIYVIVCILLCILPLHYHTDGVIYTYGPSAVLSYIVGILFASFAFLSMLINLKNIKKIKCIPLLGYIIISLPVVAIQMLYPDVLLTTPLEAFITFLMYFTIENPDLKMINELELAKNEAERANNAKSDFLSSMSHEIRTPLNAIVGFSECIMQTDEINEAHDNAKDVVDASETLLEIVNGILDISKIEAGKLEIVNSNYDTKTMFDSIVKLIKARIGDKSLDFQISIAQDIPSTLYGDHANLKKVIINLLTNAVKYTEQGFIKFEVNCVNTNDICRLMITVSDSGRGIKPEQINKLFTKFQRLEEDRNTTIEGTGLGLAITKQLTELMGGKIVVQSTYGEGSKFTVAVDQRISLEKVEEEKQIDDSDLILTGKKILIVDDNKLNLKVASKLLSKYNPSIELIESGFECIDKIKNNEQYDLILLDDMMPKMTGTETLKQLKQIEGFNTPVVVLTANAISGIKEKYLKEGFHDYLAKPIEKEELYKVLSKYLKDKIIPEIPREQSSINKQYNDFSNKKVLIVDDNTINIKIACTFLNSYNVQIETANSSKECIDMYDNGGNYDLIFMDDMMPVTTGTETMHILKHKQSICPPIVALTANALEDSRENYLIEGFDDYIAKPIDKKELDRVMNKFLN